MTSNLNEITILVFLQAIKFLIMAKDYTLDKSSSTGWWVWECKDGSGGGSAPTKSDARDAARAACSGGIVITPPDVDVIAYRGYLSNFSVENLDGKDITFSAEEISQAEFSFFFGLPCANDERIDDVQKVITVLKIWGIYRGGANAEMIKKLHYLSDVDYRKLAPRQYFGGHIRIEDDGTIRWRLP